MSEGESGVVGLRLLGGNLCLDLCNTVDWRNSDRRQDYLQCYDDLVAWSQHAGALGAAESERLRREAERRPAEAAAVLERAITLREAAYQLFSALAAGRPVAELDLATVNDALQAALPHLALAREGTSFRRTWTGGEADLQRVLWPLAWSAAELLTSEDLHRVTECLGEGCGWLFLDASRNHSRRWCAMDSCGNRAKARRHYGRRRGGAKGGEG